MKVLVTGATGFVGRSLVDSLLRVGVFVTAVVRRHSDVLSHEVEQFVLDDLSVLASIGCSSVSLQKDMKSVLQCIDVVIHTAARVHEMDDDVVDPLIEFRRINTAGTLGLASLAAEAGVNRFVFLSSIKVNGEITHTGASFKPDDCFMPDDPYGLSKYEAEQGLLALAKESGMEVVIIRPPLVYGPGVRANFASMISWINKGIPLPFGAIHNQRSLIALDNLVSFIIHCLDHPKAANEIFLISDDEDVSTTELLSRVAYALGKKSRLVPVSVDVMMFLAKLIGKESVAIRLFGSLQVDSSKARDLLGWKPVVTMNEQLKQIADESLNETFCVKK